MHLVDQRLGDGNAEELLKGPRRLSDQHLQAVDSLEAEAARLAEKRGFERRIYHVEYNGVAVHRSRGKRERRLSGHPKRASLSSTSIPSSEASSEEHTAELQSPMR